MRSASRWLLACGSTLILSGCVHYIVWLASGENWTGQVSWRKPILFGISGGLTISSLGLLLERLKPCARDLYLAPLIAVSMVLEVGLITAQQWRGVPSHFNHSTVFNLLIDVCITGLITIIAILILDYLIRAFRSMDGSAAEVLAWRGGMIYLAISCLIGFMIFAYGQWRVVDGLAPETYLSRGVVKFPHGIAIHAVQILPLCVWIMDKVRLPVRAQTVMTWSLITSFGLQLIFSLQQTLAGRSRFELSLASGTILLLSLLLCVPFLFGISSRIYRFVAANSRR